MTDQTDRDAVAAVLAAHFICAKTDEDTLCLCDRRWRRDGEYRGHLVAALAPLLAQARAEAVAAALAPVERLADKYALWRHPMQPDLHPSNVAHHLRAAVAEGKEAGRG